MLASYDLQNKPLHFEVKTEHFSLCAISNCGKVCFNCEENNLTPEHNPEFETTKKFVTCVASWASLQRDAETSAQIVRTLQQLSDGCIVLTSKTTRIIAVLMTAPEKLYRWWGHG